MIDDTPFQPDDEARFVEPEPGANPPVAPAWTRDAGIPLARPLGEPVDVESATPARRARSPWFGVLAFLLCFVLYVVAPVGAAVYLGFENFMQWVGELTAVSQILSMGVVPIGLVIMTRRSLGRDLHLARPRGLLIVALLPLLVVWPVTAQVLSQYLGQFFPPDLEYAGFIKKLVTWDSPTRMVLVTLEIAVVPSLFEELLFRGLLLASLLQLTGPIRAVLICSLLFAGVHVPSQIVTAPLAALGMMIPLAFLGIGLAILTVRTGTIVYACLLHFANNFSALLLSNLIPADFDPADLDSVAYIDGRAVAVLVAVAILLLAAWSWLARRPVAVARPVALDA